MKQFRYILASFLFIAVVAAIGFKFYNVPKAVASEGGEAAPEAPQAMPVDMGIVKAENIQIWKNFSGHVVAVNQAEILSASQNYKSKLVMNSERLDKYLSKL